MTWRRTGVWQILLLAWLVAASMVSPVCAESQGEVPGGKNVRVLLSVPPVTTDPWDAQDNTSLGISRSFYEGLLGVDQHMKLRPVLAESYTRRSDGLVYTFRLRQGVRFHDGEVFDAQAVKINFDRVRNPDNHLRRRGLFENIAAVEVVDALTVRFILRKPFGAFLNQLAHPSAGIISPMALKNLGANIRFYPVGTGPFVFDEWRRDDFLRVRRNSEYWRPGLPKVDTLTWIARPDSDSRMAMMRLGKAHFTSNLLQEEASVARSDANLVLHSMESLVGMYVSMNTRQRPFDDVRVRQALNYAVDRQALLNTIYKGDSSITEGVIPIGVTHAVQLGRWPFDREKARVLLAEAGYAGGFETELWSATSDTRSRRMVRALQEQLASVGVRATTRVLESAERAALVEGDTNPTTAPVRMQLMQWSSSTGEADWALRPVLHGEHVPPKGYNTAYYDDPVVNILLEKALEARTEEERAELYRQAQERVWNDAPWLFLFTMRNLYVVSKRLQGMSLLADGLWFFDAVDLLP